MIDKNLIDLNYDELQCLKSAIHQMHKGVIRLNLYQQTLDRVEKENWQLKKELQRMYDVATLNKAIEVLENKYDKMLSDGSDEIKDAMRHTVLRCIEDLDELKDDITAR